MNIEILCVGTELLLGDTLNSNAQFIARGLSELGLASYHQTVVGDNPKRLKEAYEIALDRADIVISTGGLGPTKDDLTKEVVAEVMNKELEYNEEVLEVIKKFYQTSINKFTENNKRQAYFSKGAKILDNPNGTAPGCIVKNDEGKAIILLPGPPREMKPMFEDHVKPYLEQYTEGVIYSKTLRVCGIGESAAEDALKELIENQTNPTIAPYAKFGEVVFRLTASAETEEKAKEMIKPLEKQVRDILGDNVYGVNADTLEGIVAQMLIEQKKTIATAESCTGGMLAGQLINYPGISEVFLEGFVTYSNESKMKRLGVKEETLKAHGAVSEEVAAEMAKGLCEVTGCDIGVSTTGIAGPGGGTEEKPVGLVYLGICVNGKTRTKKIQVNGDREKVRYRTVITMLDWIRRELVCG